MHIGFSGSRNGMSIQQLALSRTILAQMVEDKSWFHHGLCQGADHQAHQMAKELNYKVWGHPSIDSTFQIPGLLEDCDQHDAKFSYHGRNQRIVAACEMLIATPQSQERDNSSGGTWWTINCARKMGKSRIIIHRDGGVIKEEGF